MNPSPRIGLFIDGENMSDVLVIGNVVGILADVGNLTVRCAYGKVSPPKGWNAEFIRGHSLHYVPVFAISQSKKNDIVDKRMIVDAVDHLARGKPDVLAVVAGDADYSALVSHARAVVSEVWGFALTGNSAADFRNTFTRFFSLNGVKTGPGKAVLRAEVAKAAREVRMLSVREIAGASLRDDIGKVRSILLNALREDNRLLDYNSPELYRVIPDRKDLFNALTVISEESNKRHGVLLSAVVVNADKRIPGRGFFAMAKRFGRAFAANDEGMATLWADELYKAREWAKQHRED